MSVLQRIYLSPPHMSGNEEKYITEAFKSNWIAPLGPHVERFESELANYVGTKGALALNSGTAAIHLALRLLGVSEGDQVFCSSLTFIASANPILYQGAEPVFIDSEPESWNMSPKALKKAFEETIKKGKLPKAVIIVNLYGQSADMDSLKEICDLYEVPIIEDAAESLGATYKGKASGSIGKFGIFSFNGNKIITTSGGGMLVSNDLIALDKARFWATQARDKAKHYQHSDYGYNYRLSNVLAGIGRAQLELLEDRIKARQRIFYRYRDALENKKGIKFMPEVPYGRSTHWLSVLILDEKECGSSNMKLLNELESYNIEARPVWKPLHLQPLFRDNRFFSHDDGISISEKLFNSGICLPSGSSLSKEQQNFVIERILHHLGC